MNGFVIWHSHSDGQEQKERIAKIDHGVVELVKLARERNPNLTEQEALGNIAAEVRALRQRTSELDRELDGVKRYGNVAELNAFGLKGLAGSGLRETSRLSPILNEAYISRQVGGQEKFFPRCDSKGIAAFRRTAEIDPDWRFDLRLSEAAKRIRRQLTYGRVIPIQMICNRTPKVLKRIRCVVTEVRHEPSISAFAIIGIRGNG